MFRSIIGSFRNRQSMQLINEVQSLRVVAIYTNQIQESATTELVAVSHFSPRNRHIRVTSSTSAPKVCLFNAITHGESGEYDIIVNSFT
jgi:hypothetical protein